MARCVHVKKYANLRTRYVPFYLEKTMSIKNTLAMTSLAVMLSASFASSAATYNDFTVNPNAFGDGVPVSPFGPVGMLPFTADKIVGNYVEVATFGPNPGLALAANQFAISLLWEAGQFATNDGALALTSLVTGLGATYDLYALFQGTGTFSIAPNQQATFNFTSGSFDFFFDPLLDTTFGQPVNGTLPWTRGLNADDRQLAQAILTVGAGNVHQNQALCVGLNCGSFGTDSIFTLVQPDGSAFFSAPNPFYNVVLNAGQLNRFTVAQTQVITGSMNAVFNVPEPTSIALLGIGMLGLGFRARKSA